jgi:hypothetical protein
MIGMRDPDSKDPKDNFKFFMEIKSHGFSTNNVEIKVGVKCIVNMEFSVGMMGITTEMVVTIIEVDDQTVTIAYEDSDGNPDTFKTTIDFFNHEMNPRLLN